MNWVFYSSLSAILYGISFTCGYYCIGIKKKSALTFNFISKIASIFLLFLIYFYSSLFNKKLNHKINKDIVFLLKHTNFILLITIVGILFFIGDTGQQIGQALAPNPSYSAAICNSYPLVLLFLSYLYFKISLTMNEIIGCFIILGSIVLINN